MSGKFRETLAEIDSEWTLERMAEAHEALDYQEDIQTLLDQRRS